MLDRAVYICTSPGHLLWCLVADAYVNLLQLLVPLDVSAGGDNRRIPPSKVLTISYPQDRVYGPFSHVSLSVGATSRILRGESRRQEGIRWLGPWRPRVRAA